MNADKYQSADHCTNSSVEKTTFASKPENTKNLNKNVKKGHDARPALNYQVIVLSVFKKVTKCSSVLPSNKFRNVMSTGLMFSPIHLKTIL